MSRRCWSLATCSWLVLVLLSLPGRAEEPVDSEALKKWLAPQEWRRDTEGPIVTLGAAGEFDDTHVFAPCVVREQSRFLLWYCGSRGAVAERVFRLGLAESDDGRHFQKHSGNPVYEFGNGIRSVLTPTVLRRIDGTPIRENGRLRMWFSAAPLTKSNSLHTLHASTSEDGAHWSAPSPPQLEHVYAPTVLKDGDIYRLWYTDVSRDPWIIRHAASDDGRRWRVAEAPALVIDQDWERGRLFYPAVVKVEDAYLLWYGSYWSGEANKTAIGFAVSEDGLRWRKSPHNPVLRPDPSRPWESHYTTSHSVMRLPDGAWRIWYAGRKAPPFTNKYFAIATATWRP
ncbi:MAG: hypothetical protein KY475_15560 [Planctomycetes bacterium]|nr:hypothetical protein [Planctomycetota bacterium]